MRYPKTPSHFGSITCVTGADRGLCLPRHPQFNAALISSVQGCSMKALLPPAAPGPCHLRDLRSDQDSAASAGRCLVHGH